MTHVIPVGLLVFAVAVVMTMVGKGGGNFYVVILALAAVPMHEAATAGQFILFSASVTAMAVFQKHDTISWKLALLIGTCTALAALGGGYFSHAFSGLTLKLVFAGMLVLAGIAVLIPTADNPSTREQTRWGIIPITSGGGTYQINMWITVPVTLATGFGAGMVGVSGGSFLVPLMILACRVPMHTAVGTASALIAATAFMGFVGHAARGDFNPSWAVPLACIAIVGGLLGGRFALKTKPVRLKQLFALTNWLAALLMLANALLS